MQTDFTGWIGRSVTRHDVVSERVIAQFKATLAPHLFPAACPPGLHWCLALPAHEAQQLGPDGAEQKGLFLPPVPLPRRMWAGGRLETFGELEAGSPVSRVSQVSDVKWREGRNGAMCIVSVTHAIAQDGSLKLRERHDILFRGGGLNPVAAPRNPPQHELSWTVDASPLMLFRFSAITFNGHRIHYDLDWARGEEGYGGLLVHGPLQACLMLNLLSVLAGKVPRSFAYRCVAPLVADGDFEVAGSKLPTGVSGVVTDRHGVVTLEAEAE